MSNDVVVSALRLLASFLLFVAAFPTGLESLQVSNLSSIETMVPGSKKQIKISLFNDCEYTEQVDFKVVNYSCNSEGQHFFEEASEAESLDRYPRSCLSWVGLGQDRIVLEPGETREVYYSVEVPSDTDLKGSYWCVVLIEPDEKVTPGQSTEEGFRLKVKIRYAHHVVVNVGESAPKLKILKKEIREIEGNRYLCLHVLNEGDKFFHPSLTVKLFDSKGKLENTLGPQSERLYPGNPQCFYLDLQEVPEDRLSEKLTGFLLFDGKDNYLFGDKFTYP